MRTRWTDFGISWVRGWAAGPRNGGMPSTLFPTHFV